VAYDEDLANRVREQLAGTRPVTEKGMFGSLAFLVAGNMAVCVSGDELMVRVGPEGTEKALAKEHTRAFEMAGRPAKGWVKVAPEGLRTKRHLGPWVTRGVEFARSLPPKA
jgi:TfoX/Sxy family transcriptional regulator of competence genes